MSVHHFGVVEENLGKERSLGRDLLLAQYDPSVNTLSVFL